MLIGVPKEIKNHEYRIGLTPAGVRELVDQGLLGANRFFLEQLSDEGVALVLAHGIIMHKLYSYVKKGRRL